MHEHTKTSLRKFLAFDPCSQKEKKISTPALWQESKCGFIKNIPYIDITSVFIHELVVTSRRLDSVAQWVLHRNHRAACSIPARGTYSCIFHNFSWLDSNKCIKFTLEISIYKTLEQWTIPQLTKILISTSLDKIPL
jgi:hypothetical protein